MTRSTDKSRSRHKVVCGLLLAFAVAVIGIAKLVKGDKGDKAITELDGETGRHGASASPSNRVRNGIAPARPESKVPKKIIGHIRGEPFNFETMEANDRNLRSLGMGAKEAEQLESMIKGLQEKIATSETSRFVVLDQSDEGVIIGIPGAEKMSDVESDFIKDLKGISGENFEDLRSSIWPDIEVFTGDFGSRDRVLMLAAIDGGKYKLQYLDFAPGELPAAREIKEKGFAEIRQGATASYERILDAIPKTLSHIFETE